MGIKTKLCSMGGGSTYKDMGNLALWRYSNEVISGKTLLYNYVGAYVTQVVNLDASYNATTTYFSSGRVDNSIWNFKSNTS